MFVARHNANGCVDPDPQPTANVGSRYSTQTSFRYAIARNLTSVYDTPFQLAAPATRITGRHEAKDELPLERNMNTNDEIASTRVAKPGVRASTEDALCMYLSQNPPGRKLRVRAPRVLLPSTPTCQLKTTPGAYTAICCHDLRTAAVLREKERESVQL